MIRRRITLAPHLQRKIITEEELRATFKDKEMQHKLDLPGQFLDSCT